MADLRSTDEAPQQPALRTRRERETQITGESSTLLSRRTSTSEPTREPQGSRGSTRGGSDTRGLTERNLSDQRRTMTTSPLEGPSRARIPIANQRSVTAEVHAPPPPQRTPLKTVATMTEPQLNKEWSAIFNEDDGGDSFCSESELEYPQETQQEPLEQREVRSSRPTGQQQGNAGGEPEAPSRNLQPPSAPSPSLRSPPSALLRTAQSDPSLDRKNQIIRDEPGEFSLRPLQGESERSLDPAATHRVSLTPIDISRLRSSVQTHLQVEATEEEPSTSPSSPEVQICTHENIQIHLENIRAGISTLNRNL
ncbi:uncharacterized protein LOC122827646 [Gambusia affinis]|uniref:uncharacterized protein LOC122827646 n=1 Tax=Gambusia affinis TaxID=33528 RepID=UPI001CDD688C|nr:uncharacterized protein LOC122827646 [Gambusia affinis]